MSELENVVERILVTEEELKTKVTDLGQQISHDYQGKDLLVVGILKGALVFMADLIRSIKIPIQIDFMAVSSYGSSTQTSGVVRILKDLETPVEGRHVLIVEDIVDSGLTLNYLKENLRSRQAASIKVCSILDKPSGRKTQIVPDYCGFTLPDEFVVGYGLDYAERYRHIPYVAVLKPEVYEKA